jgi:hypothetical protein
VSGGGGWKVDGHCVWDMSGWSAFTCAGKGACMFARMHVYVHVSDVCMCACLCCMSVCLLERVCECAGE